MSVSRMPSKIVKIFVGAAGLRDLVVLDLANADISSMGDAVDIGEILVSVASEHVLMLSPIKYVLSQGIYLGNKLLVDF